MIPVTIDQLRIGEIVTVVRDGKTWEATVVHRSPGKTAVHLQMVGMTTGAMAYTKSEVRRFVFRKPIDRGLTTKELMVAQGFTPPPVGHGDTFDVGADGHPRKRVAAALSDRPSHWVGGPDQPLTPVIPDGPTGKLIGEHSPERTAVYTLACRVCKTVHKLGARGNDLRCCGVVTLSDDDMRTHTAPIHPSRWGRDHLSTLLYLETRIVDHKGNIKNENMRCHAGRHPERRHLASSIVGHSPTRLAHGAELADHDDWDCFEDFIAAGLMIWAGTGLAPEVRFTDRGWKVAHACRRHRAEGAPVHHQEQIMRQLAAEP